jgi:hypothetical protein
MTFDAVASIFIVRRYSRRRRLSRKNTKHGRSSISGNFFITNKKYLFFNFFVILTILESLYIGNDLARLTSMNRHNNAINVCNRVGSRDNENPDTSRICLSLIFIRFYKVSDFKVKFVCFFNHDLGSGMRKKLCYCNGDCVYEYLLW